MSVGPVPFFVVFVLIIGVVSILVAGFILWKRGPRIMEPACAKCGYAVAGLESLRCPECGSDLREIGIVTAANRRGMSATMARAILALVWTLLILFISIPLSLIGYAQLPETWRTDQIVTFAPQQGSAFPNVQIRMWGEGPVSRVAAQQGTVAAPTNPGMPPKLHIDFERGTASLDRDGNAAGAGKPLGEFNAAAMREWMVAAGAPADSPRLDAAAAELIQHTNSARTNAGIRVTGDSVYASTTSSMNVQPKRHAWFAPVAIAFWSLIWAIGIYAIVRRMRSTRTSSTS